MDEVVRKGLDCAKDFLEGLLEHLGMDGYYDPGAGQVSTRFVLDRVNDAIARIDGSGCGPVGSTAPADPHKIEGSTPDA